MVSFVDVSDIFYFFCSGEGKGLRGARKGVGGVGLWSPRREEDGRVSAGNFEGGGGLNIFFRGRNAHQVKNGVLEMTKSGQESIPKILYKRSEHHIDNIMPKLMSGPLSKLMISRPIRGLLPRWLSGVQISALENK